MIGAEEYIKKIQSELTEEQFQKLVYYLSIEHLSELKELAKIKVYNGFIKKMRIYNKKNLKELFNKSEIKKETVNLLEQSSLSLKNVHKLIRNKSIIDANAILRTSFENLIMGIMLSYDENVYNEFINLSIDDKTRKYTKPQYLRNSFRKILKDIDVEMFMEMSNKELKRMLDEFYDKLCLFTHSTLIVNLVAELRNDDCLDLYIFALKQNTYFIELILYLCLKNLNNSTKSPIDITFIIVGWFLLLDDVNKKELSENNLNKIKKLLFFDVNENYFTKSNSGVEIVKKEIVDLNKEIESNVKIVIDTIVKIIK